MKKQTFVNSPDTEEVAESKPEEEDEEDDGTEWPFPTEKGWPFPTGNFGFL
jgi:hypothetical protein